MAPVVPGLLNIIAVDINFNKLFEYVLEIGLSHSIFQSAMGEKLGVAYFPISLYFLDDTYTEISFHFLNIFRAELLKNCLDDKEAPTDKIDVDSSVLVDFEFRKYLFLLVFVEFQSVLHKNCLAFWLLELTIVFVRAVDHLLSHFYEIFLTEAAELSEQDVLFTVFGVGRRNGAERFCFGFLGGILSSFFGVVVDILNIPGFQLISLLELVPEESSNFLFCEAALPSRIEQLPNFPHYIIAKS